MGQALVAVLLSLLASLACASSAGPGFVGLDETAIARELRAIHAAHPDLPGRIEAVSERFLGVPYRLGPLGEGEGGEYDRNPRISFRELDCTTFIEETMALSLEPGLEKAKTLLQRVRYKDGEVRYEARNHFPETDWMSNNIAAGFLTDITAKVAGRRMKWVFKTIRKKDWYAAKSTADLQGFGSEPAEDILARIQRWRAAGEGMRDVSARLPYLPLEDFADLAHAIQTGTIGNIVREDLPEKPIVVTHQVLFLQTPKGTILRHAAYGKQVQDEPAAAYFERMKDAKWRVLGVNLNAIKGP